MKANIELATPQTLLDSKTNQGYPILLTNQLTGQMNYREVNALTHNASPKTLINDT
jgi:hypothetical protein